MRHALPFFIIAFALTSSLYGVQFHCKKLDSGQVADIHFDSKTPLLNEKSAGVDLNLITPTGACDQAFDFTSQCAINLIQQGQEYNYGFRCDDVFGDLYFTDLNGGAAQFRCFGEKVPAEYNDRIYRGCTVSP